MGLKYEMFYQFIDESIMFNDASKLEQFRTNPTLKCEKCIVI